MDISCEQILEILKHLALECGHLQCGPRRGVAVESLTPAIANGSIAKIKRPANQLPCLCMGDLPFYL